MSDDFMSMLKAQSDVDDDGNVLESVWNQYERVIVESLITSFGLDFIVHDQHGGDVDTIYNVRKIGEDEKLNYKNASNKEAYDNNPVYTKQLQNQYHGGSDQYIKINAAAAGLKDKGLLVDAYTGKKVKLNENIDLDHVIPTKEIHDDPGRLLADMGVDELANAPENLKPTNMSINRSMKKKSNEEFIAWLEKTKPDRQARIKELKSKNKSNLSDKERKELQKLEKLEEVDPELLRKANDEARSSYEQKLAKKYYTSKKFRVDTAKAAASRGAEMGARQVLGFIFTEIWFSVKDELQALPNDKEFKEMLEAVGRGIQKGFESAKTKYKELISKFEEGFVSGALASLTTTICNIFFTTAKNLVRCIRQMYASVVQAGKVLLFNPENLMLGDRIKTATVIIATGASVLVGTMVGELISKTPLGEAPIIGSIVQTFCSTLVSGILSCTLLIFLDRSKFMRALITELNRIPTEVNNYKEIADAFASLAVKLGNLDIERFRAETEKYQEISKKIMEADNEEDLNKYLYSAYDVFDIKIPWEGSFDEFMGNKSNRLVFE